jgi:hypothetical protein
LNLSVTDDLKKHEGGLRNYGYIEINDGRTIGAESVFFDGIDFFLRCNKKVFKKKCKKELLVAQYDWKEIYKIIKILLKRAKKLKIIE